MFTLTPAKPSDVQELSALVNSSYRGDPSRAGWTTEADYLDGQRTDPDDLLEIISKPKNVILCFRQTPTTSTSESSKSVDQTPIIGCVLLEKFKDQQGTGCYLGMLTVSPKLQSGGIGRNILEKAEDYARNWGATRITLGVIQLRDTLIAWYERRGYARTGTTLPFPYGNLRAGLPRRSDLHFVMFEKKI
jgi:GNAT superfamily N-acetyltransferase